MICKFYRFIKSRVGCSLKRTHCTRHLVPPGKQVAYQLPRTPDSLSSLTRVPRPLYAQDSTCRDRKHHSGVIHINREGGMRSGPLCALLWRILTWCARNQVTLKARHRLAECGRRQAIQARSDHPNRVVSPSGGLPSNMQQVAPASTRSICHEVQQVALVCVTGTGSPCYSSECAHFAMVGSGSIHLPTVSHIGQSGDVAGLPIQENHSDCSGLAHHALVLGSSGHVQPNPTEPAQSAQPVDTTIQSDPSQKSDKS